MPLNKESQRGRKGSILKKLKLKNPLGEGVITKDLVKSKLEIVNIEKDKMKKSVSYFIHNYVKIENLERKDDSNSIVIPFKLWEGQIRAIKDIVSGKNIIILKSRQLGLTWLVLAYALWNMIFIDGYRVGTVSEKEEKAKELIRRIQFMLKHLPRWLVRNSRDDINNFDGLIWEGTELKVTIYRYDGEPSIIHAYSSAPDAVRTYTEDLVIFDEWAYHPFAEEIFASAYPTINRPDSGKFIGLSTGEPGSLFERIWRDATMGKVNFKTIYLEWWQDPARTLDWRENAIRVLGSRGIRDYPGEDWEDAFSAGEGRVFDVFNRDAHIIKEDWQLPEGVSVILAYDGGFNNAACKWYWIDESNKVICYREYYPQKTIAPLQAQKILELSKDENIRYIVADPECWIKKGVSGLSTADVFATYGLYMIRANNDRIQGWQRLREWLTPQNGGEPKLRFTKNCINTIRTYPMLKFHKNIPEDIADGEDHLVDCDRYFVMSLPSYADTSSMINIQEEEFKEFLHLGKVEIYPDEDMEETWN